MAHLGFEGLQEYSYLGGSVDGTVVLSSDKEFRARSLSVVFRGREIAQTTVGSGKNRHTIRDERVFLDQTVPFGEALSHDDPEHVRPGTYRMPFRFEVPLSLEPSLATTELPPDRGRLDNHPDGLYVEYDVQARLDVPWWIDAVARQVVPVFSPRRVLGVVPRLATVGSGDSPEVKVDLDPAPILPGSTVNGSYQVTNPPAKELRSLTVRLFRRLEYSVKGVSCVADGPVLETVVPMSSREPYFAGRVELAVPNTAQMTGPFTGQVYRTYWMASARLDVAFGIDRIVEGPLTPA